MAVSLIVSDFKEEEGCRHAQAPRVLKYDEALKDEHDLEVELEDSEEENIVGKKRILRGKSSKEHGEGTGQWRRSRRTSSSVRGKTIDIHSDEEEGERKDKAKERQGRVNTAFNSGPRIVFQPCSPLPSSKQDYGGNSLFNAIAKAHKTLVIAPMTLISQWTDEIVAKTKEGSLRVHMYYGDKAERAVSRLGDAHVVVTSYGVLTSEMRSWVALQEQSHSTSAKVEMLTTQFAQAGNDAERERDREMR